MSDSGTREGSASGIDNPALSPEPSTATKYYTLGVLTLVYTFNFVDRQILSTIQEPIKEELMLSDFQLGLLQGAFFAVFYVVCGIFIARWAEVGNRRNIVALAITFWSLLTMVQGLAQNFWHLALARFGVGVGEAGGSPPSHSIISDLFPPSERGRALAVYSSGISVGVFLAYGFGGWVNDNMGWRTVFFVIGFPGVLVGLIIWLTVKEPLRGRYDSINAGTEAPPFKAVVRTLYTAKSFVWLSIGAGLHAFVAYGIGAFLISFYLRQHGIPTNSILTVTLPMGILIGVTGILGNYTGGHLADKLGLRDVRWYVWVPGISTALAVPFAYAAILTDSLYLSIALYSVPLFLGSMFLGPTLAMTHALVTPRMRATASAILFFTINILGMVVGPTLSGLLSDALLPYSENNAESLRSSMLIMYLVYFLSGAAYLRATKTLKQDLETVEQRQS